MNFDSSKLKIIPLDESNLASIIQIAEVLEEAPHWPLDSYKELISKNPAVRRIALVATYAGIGEVVGFVVACPIPPEAELESIGVAKAFQRRGIGRRLMDSLIRNLTESGVARLFLEVRASNRSALGFYRDLGFVQTGLRPCYYADPVEDAIQMRLPLVPG